MPLKSNISKKNMTEEDIKNRFVTSALNQAGWESGLILMEKYFTDGRILVPTKDKRHRTADKRAAGCKSPHGALARQHGVLVDDPGLRTCA